MRSLRIALATVVAVGISATALSMGSAVAATVQTATSSQDSARGVPTTPVALAANGVSSVSSAANSTGAAALSDGSVAQGLTGAAWVAQYGDATPWAQQTFTSPHRVASVQVFGPTANWVNPTAPATAAMYGMLSFSDGSSVVVSGIAGGGGSATTVAFAPRSVSWVRLSLFKTDPQVVFGLREFDVYDTGVTPPRWPSNAVAGYTAPPIAAGTCSTDTTPVGSSTDGSPALVCPRPGTAVQGITTVVVSAKPGTTLTASAWLSAKGAVVVPVGSVVADGSGRALFRIDATRLTNGPTAVRFTTGSATDRPLYVQLNNLGGHARIEGDSAPTGMTLQWNDDFRKPISVSRSGAGADYAATKPSYTGGGDFGDAIFADPAWGLNTIATQNYNSLRIRLQPTGTLKDPNGWNRTHVAGLISSAKLGGSGFSAQYGYFEARMLAPAGYGSWPAFWLLNSENTTSRETAAAEIDTVELYGQFPLGSCHSLHAWNGPGVSSGQCPNPNGLSDWALSWHTYAAWVKPDAVDYYIDNKLVATLAGPTLTNEPFFFMINESLGGGWPTNLSATGDTADLYVDWVRVYT